MTVIFKKYIYCETETAWTWKWDEGDTAITQCPNDPGHTVTAGSAYNNGKIDTEEKVFEIRQNELIDPSTATTCERGFVASIESGVNPTVAVIAFGYNADVVCGRALCDCIKTGDMVNIYGCPVNDPAVGAVAAEAASGQADVQVNPGLLEYIKPGMHLL